MTASLPNNSFFEQEPVVFFSSGPPTQNFRGETTHGPGARSQYHRRCGGGMPNYHNPHHQHAASSFSFLKSLAFGILSLFALSMLARFALFAVAVLFSPPVLLLCLFVLVVSQGWHQNQLPFNDYWNTQEFQRCFRNPRRSRRFFSTNNNDRNRGGGFGDNGTAAQRGPGPNNNNNRRPPFAGHRHPSQNATQPVNTQDPRTPSPHSPPQPAANQDTSPTDHDFELISPFNLMMAAAAAANNETAASEGTTTSGSAPPEEAAEQSPAHAASQQQKVPVHRTETDEALVIAMDVSGFDVSNIRITIENDMLCIRGERTNKIGDKFVLEEFFTLDKEHFGEDSVQATASEGVLEVKVPKKAAPQPRVISIDTTDKKD